MSKIFTVTAVLSVLALAVVGCLYIFDILEFEDSLSTLLEVVAGLALIGVCSALIAFIMRAKD